MLSGPHLKGSTPMQLLLWRHPLRRQDKPCLSLTWLQQAERNLLEQVACPAEQPLHRHQLSLACALRAAPQLPVRAACPQL